MRHINQQASGRILLDGQRTALWWTHEDEAALVYVACALITQGAERHLLPESLLDDWGNRVSGLHLYRWIRENGLSFPRAEVFGVTPEGDATQHFLRDLELFERYPAYISANPDAPAQAWRLLDAVLIPTEGVMAPELTDPPEGTRFPLREARVAWWRVAPASYDVSFIEPHPGPAAG